MGSEVFRERLADALAAGDFELHCRIYHHRSFGRLHFFDTLAVDPISRESFIVELLCRAAESETVTEVVGGQLSDLRLGDVVVVYDAAVDLRSPLPPCTLTLQVHRLKLTETWRGLFQKGEDRTGPGGNWKHAFHRPAFHDAIDESYFEELDRRALERQREKRKAKAKGEKQAESEEEASDSPADKAPWTRTREPRAMLQCHMPLAQRLAEYLGGRVLSACSRDRLVLVDAPNAEPSEHFGAVLGEAATSRAAHAPRVPSHLHSIIQRIFFVDAGRKAPSVAEACAQYLAAVFGPVDHAGVGDLWDFLCRQRHIQCFPRELESSLSAAVRASRWAAPGAEAKESPAALALPKGRCDSMVYADGLLWWSTDVPRIIVPEKDQRSVPSGAYWKLLEILDRYRPHSMTRQRLMDLFQGRGCAVDFGASPGGWSFCLATALQIRRVIACDPAAYMHPLVRRLAPEDERDQFLEAFTPEERKEDAKHSRLLAERKEEAETEPKGQISHWRMRAEDALVKMKQRLDAQLPPLALVVCDMNEELEGACQLLYQVFEQKLYEAPCLAVVTFKNTCKSKQEFRRRKSAMLLRLQEEKVLTQVQEIHLFANTRMETTIVGQML
ncbi:unnamed protein product [Effrenium voratum]|uniref:Ribosomal RNA methyltransferase FtsJ domain-containing protein n=1 Tax=Effrenium voratum TaxID=2562239 RepID=A0AA36J8S6_9DINO|nr:unnamed protein product [Effrenium voratum]CAJ1422238.1 unnamed protein product [Effrenium voratum]